MALGRRLGAHFYQSVGLLPAFATDLPCSFALVRKEGDGPRCLLQLWEPRPPERVLDTLREEFLQRLSQAEALDPGPGHFGFDDDKLWFIQELGGTPLLRVWEELDHPGREDLGSRLLEELGGSKVARCLSPEVIGIRPGRILAPRLLGAPRGNPAALVDTLDEADLPPGTGPGHRPWNDPRELSDASWLPIRGRTLELTYLKSLMFGLSAAIPMERMVLLLGEGGLGHERLCDWAMAAAETEGIWVSNLDAHPAERAGDFLERLVGELITGLEPELYAALPAVARCLSRRMAVFAFLRGQRNSDFSERPLETVEVEAALEALAFAQARHRRLIQVRSLECATPEVHDLLKDLVLASSIPWLLASRGAGQGAGLKSCTTALKNHPEAAMVVLDRLEDEHIARMVGDILGPHDLPKSLVEELCTGCLGNPGLMQSFLEMGQLKGTLIHRQGRWTCPQGLPPKVELQEDLVQGILAGRLLRVNPATLALVRYLALIDAPLPLATLGRALGLDADGVEEAVNAAVSAKLVLAGDASASLSSALVRDLALAKMPPNEIIRCARLLLRILDEQGGRPGLSVRLQRFALDPGTALAQVLQGIEGALPGAQAAQRILEEALELDPGPSQRARLWEFLSDNWSVATEGDRLAADSSFARSPFELALDALNRALEALGDPVAGAEDAEQRARLHRKKALLEMRLRRFREAAGSLGEAAALLADRPFHPEQPRLCLAQGQLHMLEGQGGKGLKALEEGLRLLGEKGAEDRQDQVALMLELGRVQGQRALFQSAQHTLNAAKRELELLGDRRRLVRVLEALGAVHQGLGQTDQAGDCLRDALGLARALDDVELTGSCHLQLGILRSCQQLLAPALAHLDSAYRRFATLGDQALATQAQAWKARTLGGLGDGVLAELLILQASAVPVETLSPVERGDRAFLEGEMAAFRGHWNDARRHFLGAANRFEEAGLAWRERLARLRCIQAEARLGGGGAALKSAWIRLEGLKGPVEASGSRWLELEWHRAHALLLALSGSEEVVIAEALLAWGVVLAAARELKYPVLVLEASAGSAQLLLGRGERLGARSRVQDALPAFQEVWSQVPPTFAKSFLERQDIQAFQEASEQAGLAFTLPERVDPLPEWSPTQANLPEVPAPRVNP